MARMKLGPKTIAPEGAAAHTQGMTTFQASLLTALLLGAAPARAQMRVDGAPTRCLEFGRHSEVLPEFNPMSGARECLSDPFETPAAFQAAWTALLARLARDGGPQVPYSTEFETGFQQAIGEGLAKPEDLSAEKYWGDIAVLYLQKDGKSARGTTVTTYRAYRSKEADATRVKATRYDFHADRDGVLDMVQRSDGELSPDGRMMWAPKQTVGQGDWVGAPQVRQWRQLVDALSRR